MSVPAAIIAALTRPDAVVFAENHGCLQALSSRSGNLVASRHPSGTVWRLPTAPPASGLRISVTSTGHSTLYGDHGHRILQLDPGGTPLHECAWDSRGPGPPRLLRARLHLDWGQWVGLKPEGLVNEACFDISRTPGWQRLTTEDLHRMAAQAMGVTPEEIAFFYDETNLTLDGQGRVTIRHRKDAFYALEDGTFAKPTFLACMGAMHWGRIDFLPVVELFQSLPAGTGSATFELIRGLYDDQNRNGPPRPLRYQGIPVYPSPQAFQLFSTYFSPDAPGGADPFPLFMDPARSREVIWRPRAETPRRYMDLASDLCVTVLDGAVQKVTRRDDPAAIPYGRARKDGFAPGGRMVGATKDFLQLQDGDRREEIALKPEWGITRETPLPASPSAVGPTWRTLFPDGVPALDMVRAYFAVPLYPEDDALVSEAATQPLVMEQALNYLERVAAASKGSSVRGAVLIHNWDTVIAECLDSDQDQDCTVLYTRPEFAQRQAQRAWDQATSAGRLSRLRRVAFLEADRHRESAYAHLYGLIYAWIPFERYRHQAECERDVTAVSNALAAGGFAVLVGPPWLDKTCSRNSLRLLASDPVAETDGVRMHRAIMPKTRVNPEATMYLLQKM
jgi:hypothetical protein